MALRKRQRIRLLLLGAVLMAGAAGLVSYAFNDTIAFFKSPTEMLTEGPSPSQLLRLGGLVTKGSVVRGDGRTITFDVTDGHDTLKVSYTGVLPDLFREGQGVVAEGYYRGGEFVATEVLAKHDSKYMPKEVVDELKKEGHWKDEYGKPEPAAAAKVEAQGSM